MKIKRKSDEDKIVRQSFFAVGTVVLVAINVIVFVSLQTTGRVEQAINDYGFQPTAFMQGKNPASVVTSAFLHADLGHLVGNMIYLAVFGVILERRIGTFRFLAVYFLAHMAAMFFGMALNSGSTMFGASAAISGLVGACFAGYPFERGPLGMFALMVLPLVSIFLPPLTYFSGFLFIIIPLMVLASAIFVPLWPFALIFLLHQLARVSQSVGVGLVTDLRYWAHIVGFICGEVLIVFLARRQQKPCPEEPPAEPFSVEEFGGS